MAKVMIDIPDRYIDAVKGLMMMQADSEQEAQKTERAADLLKQVTEPIVIDTTDAVTAFIMHQVTQRVATTCLPSAL